MACHGFIKAWETAIQTNLQYSYPTTPQPVQLQQDPIDYFHHASFLSTFKKKTRAASAALAATQPWSPPPKPSRPEPFRRRCCDPASGTALCRHSSRHGPQQPAVSPQELNQHLFRSGGKAGLRGEIQSPCPKGYLGRQGAVPYSVGRRHRLLDRTWCVEDQECTN